MGDAVSCQPVQMDFLDDDSNVSLDSDMEERVAILDMAESRLNFHKHRSKALWQANRARTQLAEYARLSVKVVEARGLEPAGRGWDCEPHSDPYVQVYLNDVLKHSTPHIGNSVTPMWNWDCALPIQCGASIVRLQVMNYNFGKADDMLSFVEFPVVDVPLTRTFTAWLSLSAPCELCNTAGERWRAAQKVTLASKIGQTWRTVKHYVRDPLADAIVEVSPPSGGHGSILVEVRLLLADEGIASDEWFAHCLPTPTWHIFPDAGALTLREDLNVQKIYDRVVMLVDLLLNGLVSPCVYLVMYVLMWREIWLSLLVTTLWVFLCWFPRYFIAGLFGSVTFTLLALRNPSRRRAMAANPGNCALNDDGFIAIASMNSTPHMAAFLERVITVMRGRVLDEGKLMEFAAFSFEGSRPVVTYAELKQQLRDAAQSDKPFLSFTDAPLKAGTLVRTGTNVGEITQCVNPDPRAATRTYNVKFDDISLGEKVIEEDQLETYLNLRWMSYPSVKMVIPASVVETLLGWQQLVETASIRMNRAVCIAHDTMSWKYFRRTGALTAVFLALTVKAIAEVAANAQYIQEETNWGHFADFKLGREILSFIVKWTLIMLKIFTMIIMLVVLLWNATFAVFIHQSVYASYARWKHRRKQPEQWKCCEEVIVTSSETLLDSPPGRLGSISSSSLDG